MTQSARQNDIQATHTIRYDFTWNTVNANPNGGGAATTQALAAAQLAAGVQIGTLPAGAVPVSTNAYVDVAFTNGTNNLFSVGYTATGTDLVSAGSLASQAAVLTPAPIAAVATAKAQASKAGTPIYLSTSQTGTAAGAGQASVIVAFHPNLG